MSKKPNDQSSEKNEAKTADLVAPQPSSMGEANTVLDSKGEDLGSGSTLGHPPEMSPRQRAEMKAGEEAWFIGDLARSIVRGLLENPRLGYFVKVGEGFLDNPAMVVADRMSVGTYLGRAAFTLAIDMHAELGACAKEYVKDRVAELLTEELIDPN